MFPSAEDLVGKIGHLLSKMPRNFQMVPPTPSTFNLPFRIMKALYSCFSLFRNHHQWISVAPELRPELRDGQLRSDHSRYDVSRFIEREHYMTQCPYPWLDFAVYKSLNAPDPWILSKGKKSFHSKIRFKSAATAN